MTDETNGTMVIDEPQELTPELAQELLKVDAQRMLNNLAGMATQQHGTVPAMKAQEPLQAQSGIVSPSVVHGRMMQGSTPDMRMRRRYLSYEPSAAETYDTVLEHDGEIYCVELLDDDEYNAYRTQEKAVNAILTGLQSFRGTGEEAEQVVKSAVTAQNELWLSVLLPKLKAWSLPFACTEQNKSALHPPDKLALATAIVQRSTLGADALNA